MINLSDNNGNPSALAEHRKAYQRAAQQAIDVQNACNLSGVIHTFSNVMSVISRESDILGKGTTWKNHHPIAVMFGVQIAHLTRVAAFADEGCNYNKCFAACEKLAAGEPVDWDE